MEGEGNPGGEGRAEGPQHRGAVSGQMADSPEKALSRRPGLLDTGAGGTAAPVAGTLSGSTTLREVKERVSKEPRPRLPPPAWPLTSSPRWDSLPHPRLRPHPHRPPLGGLTTQGQQSTGQAPASSQPGPPGSLTHPRSRSWPHCWLQRERERETEPAQRGLSSARPQPHGPGSTLTTI